MGVVRIDNNLQKKVQKWINKNGNKFQFSSITSFINSAIYEKLKKIKGKKDGENRSQ